MDEDEIVIVGDDGTEHVFPSGFDPRRAAAIVRNGGSSALPSKPVSAEDFAPVPKSKGWPAIIGDAVSTFGRKTIGAIPETLSALSDLQRGTLGGDLEASRRTGERVKGMLKAQADQFRKAGEAETPTEATAHFFAGLTPLVGPAAADAGEAIARGDTGEGLGEAAALLAPFGVARGAPAALRGAQAAGRGAARVAGKAGPLAADVAGTAGLELAAHALGGVPGTGVVTRALLEPVIRSVRARRAAAAAAEKSVPPLAMHGPEIEASLQGSVWPKPAMHGPEVSPNFGGKLVKPTPEAEIAEALAELQAEMPRARRITTPPPPELRPGYTPRTTAPRPRPAAPQRAPVEPPAQPQTPPATTKRPYFLRSDAEMQAIERAAAERVPVEPSDFADARNLPASWRQHMDQPVAGLTSAEVRQMAEAMTAEGISPAEAIRAVSKNAQLPPNVRIDLMTALGRMAKRR